MWCHASCGSRRGASGLLMTSQRLRGAARGCPTRTIRAHLTLARADYIYAEHSTAPSYKGIRPNARKLAGLGCLQLTDLLVVAVPEGWLYGGCAAKSREARPTRLGRLHRKIVTRERDHPGLMLDVGFCLTACSLIRQYSSTILFRNTRICLPLPLPSI